MDTVWSIPDSCGPDSFVEPGVNAHIWTSHLLHGKFPDLSEGPRGTLLETHRTDVPVNVDDVFSGHYLVDDRTALLHPTTFFVGTILPGQAPVRKKPAVVSNINFYSGNYTFTCSCKK